jgi:hypothetical protein
MDVFSDDRQAVRTLVEQMVRQGHRRIAFAGTGEHARAYSERLAGYRDAISSADGGRLRPRVYESRGVDFADGLAIGREIFSKSRRPTALQCITDDLAAGVIAAAHERRLAMPEALSVAGFDNFGLATRLYPALSTVTLPMMTMAAAATRQVLDTLEGRDVVPCQHFGCEVALRDSIGVPRAPQARPFSKREHRLGDPQDIVGPTTKLLSTRGAPPESPASSTHPKCCSQQALQKNGPGSWWTGGLSRLTATCRNRVISFRLDDNLRAGFPPLLTKVWYRSGR